MKLTSDAASKIDDAMKSATRDPFHSMPRAVFMATSSSNTLFSGAKGATQVPEDGINVYKEVSSRELTTENSIFELWSCTKLVTVIAALQLIEQGKMALHDDASQWCPELRDIQVLEELEKDDNGNLVDPVFIKKEGVITIEMLINHTSGFTYLMYVPKHNRYRRKHGLGSPYQKDTTRNCVTKMPLMYQPAEHWFYGTSNDWLSMAIEQVSGLPLEAYFKEHIFNPLDITDMSFKRNPSCVNLAYANEKNPAEAYKYGPATIFSEDPMGGAGLMGSPASYLKILRCILNDGNSLIEGQARVLEAETVALMFAPSLREQQQQEDVAMMTKEVLDPFSRKAKKSMEGINWGYGGALSGEGYASGRSKGSMTWAGYSSCHWVIDKKKDIAFSKLGSFSLTGLSVDLRRLQSVLFTSILPLGMQPVFDFWEIAETELYKGLGLGPQKALL